ncbi:MAG: hypothetical protein NTU79_17525 [Planctomycetota bacterium]|nr:hypothetical protein [Planctomycetota bacterium]
MATLSKQYRDAAASAVDETDARFNLPEFIQHWLNSEYNNPAIKNTMPTYPELDRNQVEKFVRFERICDGYTGWIRRAAWRRIITTDIEEFAKFILMQGRQGIITHEPDNEFSSECTDLYNVLLPLLAVNDRFGLDRYLSIAEFKPKSSQSIPMVYCAVGAILRGVPESQEPFLKRRTPKSDSAAMAGMIDAIKGILNDDADQFTNGLTQFVERYRRQFLFEYQKPYSIEAHGLFQLGRISNPELVKQFNVSSSPPWDSEFHYWIATNDAKLEVADFGNCPVEYLEPFLTLNRPKWYTSKKGDSI